MSLERVCICSEGKSKRGDFNMYWAIAAGLKCVPPPGENALKGINHFDVLKIPCYGYL